jgi:pSer/pThr/pTyr-binding forkhead associated (FHA) protein
MCFGSGNRRVISFPLRPRAEPCCARAAPRAGDSKQKVSIGREPPCAFVIRDETVSAKHAELTLGSPACTLRDLGSTNGCVVNGRDLPRNGAAKVRAGDVIELGDAFFVLERVQAEEEAVSSGSDAEEGEEEEEEEEAPPRPLRATGGLAVSDVRVGKKIGGGSFGTVFDGSWNGEAIVLKQANVRVEGAVELLELELQLNEVAAEKAPDACASFIGALEVSEATSGPTYAGKLSAGLWLAWRAEGACTLWYYLQRRGSTAALASALGLDTEGMRGAPLEAAVARRVLVQTLTCLDAFHTAGTCYAASMTCHVPRCAPIRCGWGSWLAVGSEHLTRLAASLLHCAQASCTATSSRKTCSSQVR